MNSSKRIEWLNGLKGISCLIVFFHHYFMSFYSAIYYGDTVSKKTASGIDVLFSYEPYGFLLNGNYSVTIFILISAFLFAGKGIKAANEEKNTDLLKLIVSRYLRLMPPTFLAGLIYYVLIIAFTRLNINYCQLSSELSFLQFIKHAALLQFITMDSTVMGPFWCLYLLFLGSFLAFFIGLASKKEYRFMPVVILVAAKILLYVLNGDYLPVFLGALLADIYYNERIPKMHSAIKNEVGVLLVVTGLALGGYPSYILVTPKFFLHVLISRISLYPVFAHSVGAFLLCLGIMLITKKVVLSSKVMGKLGDISFAIFLTHTIVINLFSYWFVDFLNKSMSNYAASVWICFIVTTLIVFIVSVLFKMLIEDNINKGVKVLMKA